MPQPIVPLHIQEGMPITFGDSTQPEFHLSELQQILLQSTSTPVRKKYSVNVVEALQQIDRSTDLIVTAVSDSNERHCAIPSTMAEETVLTLKAEGLIAGYGRSVKITERGRTALRDQYLSSKNAIKETKNSDKFDYRSFSRIAFKKEK